ncbi:MAG: BON domain-containing protein [Pseudomonadota bacterium]|nr:BON domain-containing protein [Pseudomonadota bacterium]
MKSDNDMQQDVRDELLRMLSGRAETLNVQVLEGVVTLTGRVDSDSQKWRVADAIRRLPGVRDLVDEIEVFALEAPGRGADADAARDWFPPR